MHKICVLLYDYFMPFMPFEHHVLIIRRSELYYTASGIVTPVGVMITDAARNM